MPLYFAYGANMDRTAMRKRCPDTKSLGPATLPGRRLFVAESGYASVRPHAGAVVHGVAWRLAWRDVPALDEFEEVAAGLYSKRYLPIRIAGHVRSALVYVGRHGGSGRPAQGYMEAVVAAAEDWRLPANHLKQLRHWLPRTDCA